AGDVGGWVLLLLGGRLWLLLCGRGDVWRHLGDGDVVLREILQLVPVSPRPRLGGLGRHLGLLGFRAFLRFRFGVRGKRFLFLELDVAVRAGDLALALGAGTALVPATVAAATAAAVAVPAAVTALFQMPVIGRLDIGDVQEAVAAHAEVNEGRLDARLDVDDASLVDVVDVALVAGPLDVQFLQHSILEDGDAAFLRLEDVDQHYF